MARIIIRNLFRREIEVSGPSPTLLQVLQQERIDWMHACGGKGRCTTCKVIVNEGSNNFGKITEAENRYRLQGALSASERLACQAVVLGDADVSAPDEYKLPHINYSDDR
jgi:2Fe-2S ferredoxin